VLIWVSVPREEVQACNRVRAYEKVQGGDLYLEWHEDEWDPEIEEFVRKKKRAKLDHRDRDRAEEQAKKAAARLLLLPEQSKPESKAAIPFSLRRLLDEYNEEVTPRKRSRSKREHDGRAKRLFIAFFEAQKEPARRIDRHPVSLDRVDWDRFVEWRREGRIPGWGPVKDRAVQYDLVYMIGVLNWALGVKGPDGAFYLQSNPWGAEVRRSQSWVMPKERNPRRVAMTDAVRDELVKHSASWQFELALIMERHTRRRREQIRQLLWSDLDMEGRRIRWRGETDKSGKENWTPMPAVVHQAIQRLVPQRGIGNAPLFPSASDLAKPTTRYTFDTWLRRAKRAWLGSIEGPEERERLRAQLRGVGYHSEKRAGVRDPKFRALPPPVQEELAATRYETLREVYDEVSFADLEVAQAELDGRATADVVQAAQ
jgi:hypothetical protein